MSIEILFITQVFSVTITIIITVIVFSLLWAKLETTVANEKVIITMNIMDVIFMMIGIALIAKNFLKKRENEEK